MRAYTCGPRYSVHKSRENHALVHVHTQSSFPYSSPVGGMTIMKEEDMTTRLQSLPLSVYFLFIKL